MKLNYLKKLLLSGGYSLQVPLKGFEWVRIRWHALVELQERVVEGKIIKTLKFKIYSSIPVLVVD